MICETHGRVSWYWVQSIKKLPSLWLCRLPERPSKSGSCFEPRNCFSFVLKKWLVLSFLDNLEWFRVEKISSSDLKFEELATSSCRRSSYDRNIFGAGQSRDCNKGHQDIEACYYFQFHIEMKFLWHTSKLYNLNRNLDMVHLSNMVWKFDPIFCPNSMISVARECMYARRVFE